MTSSEPAPPRPRAHRWPVIVASCLGVGLMAVSGAWVLSASGTSPAPADTAQAHAQWQADLRDARAEQAAAERTEAQEAAREAAAERRAAKEAARRKAARKEAARARAAERELSEVTAEPLQPAQTPPVEAPPALHSLHGEMTVRNIEGALVTQVGGFPGQALSTFSMPQLNRLQRLLKTLERGATYPCPGGSGGGFNDIAVGTQVVVEDGTTGAVVATTSLTGGTLGVTGCTFSFDVQVPEAAFYKVEVSHRGEVAFSRQDLEAQGWRLSMTL